MPIAITLVSAAKRKHPKDLIVEALKLAGENEAAEQIAQAGRITPQLIDRVMVPLVGEDAPEEPKSEEEQVDNELIELFNELENHVANSDWKKAKKTHKKLKKLGLSGSEMDRYKRIIKENTK